MPLENTGNKIIAIRYLKEKVSVRFISKTKIDIPNEVFASFYLYKGKEISDKEFSKIEEEIKLYDLSKYAKKLCASKAYSEFHLREKLYLKNSNKEEVDEIVKRMKRLNLIDDESYIKEYIEFANEKNYGKNKIIAKLLAKGIFKEKLDKIVFDEKIEKNKAKAHLNYLLKKYEGLPYRAKKDKVIAYLVNQGFDLDVAFYTSDSIVNTHSKLEHEQLKSDYKKCLTKYKNKYQGYELKEHIKAALIRKGYDYQNILELLEEK